MDPYEAAPAVTAIAADHALAASAPDSSPPTVGAFPELVSREERFPDVEAVIARVRHLHEQWDPDVAPHRSKYAARIIMTDVLAQLRGEITKGAEKYTTAELQWLTEQCGRLEYLNGVNHIEAEETSTGEKMLNKAMRKFKDQALAYPFDVLDGYNHLAIVWSNRSQHEISHAYLQIAQQAFLKFKKLRQSALEQLTDDERRQVATLDTEQQMRPAPTEDEAATAVNGTAAEPSSEAAKESSNDAAAASASTTTAATSTAAAPVPTWSLSPSHPGYRFLDPVFWQHLEVTHTQTLFFLAQVFGHMKKRDLAAIYCHLVLNRQLKQRKDFARSEWVTNAIGLSFYYSGRKLFQQAHHCLIAAQSFISEKDFLTKKNTPTADTTKDQQLAADLCRAWGAFYLKWLQRSRDLYIESDQLLPQVAPTPTATPNTDGTAAPAAPAAASKDDIEPADPTSSLSSLPEAELAELKRLQRLDRERERHFENTIEIEADEEEDELFGDLSKARKMKSPEQLEAEAKDAKPIDRTLPSSLTREEQLAVTEELKKNVAEDDTPPTTAVATNAPAADSAAASAAKPASTHLFIEFKSLNLPPSPVCEPAKTFVAARALFKLSLDWFTRAGLFYILDGYVSDHIPIQQDISLLYKLLAVFDMDLSRQCKMHKRRIDLLTPIHKQLSLASYQEFYQQLADEIASAYAEMMELKQFILQMKIRLLGKQLSEKKRDEAQQKINELALHAIQYYSIWLQSWSKDGKEVETLDSYYHRWYLMAMFKIARCYSKIYSDDPQVLNQFILKALNQYRAVVAKALAWDAVGCMPEELALCKEMIDLLPHKMRRVMAKGGFQP